MLIELEDTIISSEIFSKKFVCDLNACKGACCVLGDAGAPITPEEVKQIEENIDLIKPFMNEKGKAVIDHQGISYLDHEGQPATSLVDHKECAFVVFNEQGTALCSIETAFRNDAIPNLKPISCALYPIRLKKFEHITAVQFDNWDICQAACACGEQLDVPVYKFLKNPIIRAFGENYFKELEIIAKELKDLED